MIYSPYDMWKHGVHRAVEVDPVIAERVRDSLATYVTYGIARPLADALASYGVDVEEATLLTTPSPSDDNPYASYLDLNGLLKSAMLAPGAVDIGIGLWDVVADGAATAKGRYLIDESAGVSHLWIERQLYVNGCLVDARDASASLAALEASGVEPGDESRDAVIAHCLDECGIDTYDLDDDVDRDEILFEESNGRAMFEAIWEQWRAGLKRAIARYRRDVDAVIANGTGMLLVSEDENMSI